MKLSHYLKIFESRDNPDECIAFSTKRASIVQLARETLNEISSGDLCRRMPSFLPDLRSLFRMWRPKKSDARLWQNWGRSSPVLNIVAILNLDCNFACPYCYENGIKGDFYMSRQTADALIAFASSVSMPTRRCCWRIFTAENPPEPGSDPPYLRGAQTLCGIKRRNLFHYPGDQRVAAKPENRGSAENPGA